MRQNVLHRVTPHQHNPLAPHHTTTPPNAIRVRQRHHILKRLHNRDRDPRRLHQNVRLEGRHLAEERGRDLRCHGEGNGGVHAVYGVDGGAVEGRRVDGVLVVGEFDHDAEDGGVGAGVVLQPAGGGALFVHVSDHLGSC